MNAPDPRLGRILLLGQNFGQYGAVSSTRVGSQAAVGITVGSDEDSPSNQYKYNPDVMNEDTLCMIAAPDWIGMAVADAHYGEESSHMLLGRLHDIWAKVKPRDPAHLQEMMEFLRQGEPARTESETTLLVSIYDRDARTGFGINYGDSSFAIGGPSRVPVHLNQREHKFVSAADPGSFREGTHFSFSAEPGEMLLAYTDGIDGCHYGFSETSIQPEHIHQIMTESSFDPLDTINAILSLALTGVDGNPGGQDNIAVAAAIA